MQISNSSISTRVLYRVIYAESTRTKLDPVREREREMQKMRRWLAWRRESCSYVNKMRRLRAKVSRKCRAARPREVGRHVINMLRKTVTTEVQHKEGV